MLSPEDDADAGQPPYFFNRIFVDRRIHRINTNVSNYNIDVFQNLLDKHFSAFRVESASYVILKHPETV